MFSAWNQKQKQPNMPSQNANILSSIGRFVGEIGKEKG